MKQGLYTLATIAILCTNFTTIGQSKMSIVFDIRGRDCAGGLGLCSAQKTNQINEAISIQKMGEGTFVLTINRSTLTEA